MARARGIHGVVTHDGKHERLARTLATVPGCGLALGFVGEALDARVPDWPELDDERLADLVLALACATGDGAATTLFVERYAGEISRIARGIGQGAATDDFVQHALTHLLVGGDDLPRIGRYVGRGRLHSFVRMVTSRLAIDLVRTESARRPTDAAVVMPASSGDPLSTLEDAEGAEHVAAALGAIFAELRPIERRVLRMRYVLGFSVSRTSVALRIHEVSVSRMITRVRARILERLRSTLADDAADGVQAAALASIVRSLDVSIAGWLRTNPTATQASLPRDADDITHAYCTHAPIVARHSSGAAPSSNHGTQLCPSRHAASSPIVQNGLQQPVLPPQPGTLPELAQKFPGSQTLRNSHASPGAPWAPEASGAHWNPSPAS
jgi:RNA polymerase sigma-70 factor (ECF subfamily)